MTRRAASRVHTGPWQPRPRVGAGVRPRLDLDARSGLQGGAHDRRSSYRDPRAHQVLRRPAGVARARPARRGRLGPGPAGLERRRQDHGREDLGHAPEGGRRDGQGAGPRRRDAGRAGPGVHQPDRAVRRRGRCPHGPGEPPAHGRAAPPRPTGPGRRRTARALRPHRRWTPAGCDVLRRHAAPARHRDEPGRRPAGPVPRRADDWSRPAVASGGVADGPQPRGRGHHSAADHPVTSKRPSTSPIGSRSCTRDGSWWRGRSPSCGACCRLPRSSSWSGNRRCEDVFLAVVGADGDEPSQVQQ